LARAYTWQHSAPIVVRRKGLFSVWCTIAWIEDETKSARLGKDLTLDHYNELAEDFWQGTRDHDVKQNIAALLQWVEGKTPFTILDFGCGPGRDLKVFSELGHIAVGLEGACVYRELHPY
jgi:hypothetical protein